jgi:hypothetical protein
VLAAVLALPVVILGQLYQHFHLVHELVLADILLDQLANLLLVVGRVLGFVEPEQRFEGVGFPIHPKIEVPKKELIKTRLNELLVLDSRFILLEGLLMDLIDIVETFPDLGLPSRQMRTGEAD